jgi:hypothetical protein
MDTEAGLGAKQVTCRASELGCRVVHKQRGVVL